jgi:drug/metabolite transporter (DMT)-like permease
MLSCVILVLFNGYSGLAFKDDAFWLLVVSSVAGLVIGDFLYFKALIHLGPQKTTQLLTVIPFVSASVAWFWIGEILTIKIVLGMIITIFGILCAVLFESHKTVNNDQNRFKVSFKAYVFGSLAVLLHGISAVCLRQAYLLDPGMDPFFATTLRISIGALIIVGSAISSRHLTAVFKSLRQKGIASRITIGTITGPVLGMVCYVSSFKFLEAGLVSALSGLSPLVIILIVAIKYRIAIDKMVLLGTVIAVFGVIVMNYNG